MRVLHELKLTAYRQVHANGEGGTNSILSHLRKFPAIHAASRRRTAVIIYIPAIVLVSPIRMSVMIF